MSIYCCQKCNTWNSCDTKWVRTEKDEPNLCCSSCFGYAECLRKDIESILQDRSSKLDWIRNELEEVLNPAADENFIDGLKQKDFKIFVTNYALSGFWILYGLETGFLERSILYTLAIIPSVFIFWIVLRKVHAAALKKV